MDKSNKEKRINVQRTVMYPMQLKTYSGVSFAAYKKTGLHLNVQPVRLIEGKDKKMRTIHICLLNSNIKSAAAF